MHDFEMSRNIELPRLLSGGGLMPVCEPTGDEHAATLGDDTVNYVLATQKAFRKLRQAISQSAGALILDAASGRASNIAEEGYRLARASMAEVADLFASARPTARAAHHHHHLKIAIDLVGQALASQRNCSSLMQGAQAHRDILPLLKRAWQELAHAARALPGFEAVDFNQACCAFHQKGTP